MYPLTHQRLAGPALTAIFVPQRSRIKGLAMAVALLASLAAVAPASAQQTIGGCQVFPISNIWNTPIANLPVAGNSSAVVGYIGNTDTMHPDFGTVWQGAPIGIPFVVVPNNQAMLPIDFASLDGWPDESDAGPYPIPTNPPIEGADVLTNHGDRHILVVQQTSCVLFELYHSWREGENNTHFTCSVPGATPGWCGLSGAKYDLSSNALREDGWTSADAAGLPIFPGLVRYDEVQTGEIRHALRFTVDVSRTSWVWPARHESGATGDANAPPMGLRFRMKKDFTLPGASARVRTILAALKKYGMIVADNGTDWYLNGAPDARWDDDELSIINDIPGSAFEVVNVSSLLIDANSGVTPHLFSDGFDIGTTVHWSAVAP
ncbi:MAG: hypothetical protein ABI639_10240 [Thermoanaerobaculia bacterium]